MEFQATPCSEQPKPKAILKLVEQEKSGLSDSGLADSRNVTLVVSTAKIVEFSPLTTHSNEGMDKSVCVGRDTETDSEEITLDSSMENAPTGPMQSSGLSGVNFNTHDISTINQGISFFSLFSWSRILIQGS